MGHRTFHNWISRSNLGLADLIMIKTSYCIVMNLLILSSLTCTNWSEVCVSRETGIWQSTENLSQSSGETWLRGRETIVGLSVLPEILWGCCPPPTFILSLSLTSARFIQVAKQLSNSSHFHSFWVRALLSWGNLPWWRISAEN